jgi:proteasome lid subunit RPN8/RPN11
VSSPPDVRAIRTEDLPEEPFPEAEHGFRVHLGEAAFDQAVARGTEDADREIGGILVGRLCRDAGGPYVRVDTTIDALHAEEKGTELTFTHETWAHVHEIMDRDHTDRQIVGWYHTHPGFGVFLSDRDRFIHQSFFDLPHQIALVYDPKSREHGVFTWREGEPERCRRYWIGTREQTWEPPMAKTAKPAKREPEAPAKERETESVAPPPLDRYSLGIGAILLLLLGGAVGWWMSGGTRRVKEEDLTRQLLAARLAGAQEVVKDLDLRVLELVRQTVDQRSAVEAKEALDRLAAALEKLEGSEPTPAPEALAELREATVGLAALVQLQREAALTLRTVADARKRIDDPRLVRRELGVHTAALGQLFLEQAEDARRAGDLDRARRLLETAAKVDPGKRVLYEKKIADLAGGEEPPR